MSKKILIIDDDIGVVESFKVVLEDSDYKVIVAKDGTSGLKTAVAEKPDLIFLDILMPNKDGLSMLRELRAKESTKRIPVVVVSARSGSSYLMQAKELGVEDYVVKPYSAPQILGYVKKYIE